MERKNSHPKWVVLRDTCDYPTISNAYFTMVSEPKLSDDMKGERNSKMFEADNSQNH